MNQVRSQIARSVNQVFRFRELSLCDWAFSKLPEKTWTSFPLYGGKMFVHLNRSRAQQLLYLMRERMLEEQALVRQLIKPGMHVLDVGANIGYYLLLIESLIGPQGQVICIEPNPENLPELKRVISENAFANVELHEVALGAQEMQASSKRGINGGIEEATEDSDQIVRVVPLDQLIDQPIDVVKIDVDGYEAKVLEGCMETFRKCHPRILLEMHPHLLPAQNGTCQEIYDRLIELNYDIMAYHTKRPSQESIVEKVRNRYWPGSQLVKIVDVSTLIQQADQGEHPWTFWLVCE